jgi:hypothetical protein
VATMVTWMMAALMPSHVIGAPMPPLALSAVM